MKNVRKIVEKKSNKIELGFLSVKIGARSETKEWHKGEKIIVAMT